MDETFYPIRLNTLRYDETIPFDIYVKLASRYIHYSRTNDEMEGERLKNLKDKGVRKLFIKPEDETHYLKYLEKRLERLSDTSTDVSTRAALAHDTMITAVENAERNLETQEGFKNQKNQMDKISEFIISDRNAIKSMLSTAGIAVENNHHSANVSALCIAVASKSGIEDKAEIFDLCTAALLHDIGKNRLKFNHSRPHSEMTPDEWKKYKEHAREGSDMLAGKPYISGRILGLIASHEEYGIGKGYPEKKNIFSLPVAYQILSMVNKFDHLATELKLKPFEAVDPFFDKYGADYDQNLISSLATVLT